MTKLDVRMLKDKEHFVGLNVAQFLPDAVNDSAAFAAAVAAISEGDEGTIYVPDIGRPWNLLATPEPGRRRITWVISPNAKIAGNGIDWIRLKGAQSVGRGVYVAGFGNRNDNTAHITRIGSFDTQIPSAREADITSLDTLQQQAYVGERGRAAEYVSVGDSGVVSIPGANVTSHTQIVIPAGSISTSQLRVGMWVDAPGTTFPRTGSPTRYTTRITGWTTNGSGKVTSLQIEGWYRSNSSANAAVHELPSVDSNSTGATREILVNPLNKVWGNNTNIFLTRTGTSEYDKTSACFAEYGILNNSGEEMSDEFDNLTRRRSFYGLDLSNIGNNGGGAAVVIRGKSDGSVRWLTGIRVSGALRGVHVEGTQSNTGGQAFLVSRVPGTGGHDTAFLSRKYESSQWQNMVELRSDNPTIALGNGVAVSVPLLAFRSSGFENEYDSRIRAYGGTSAGNGQGVIQFTGRLQADGLPRATTGLAANELYVDPVTGNVKMVL